MEPNAITAQIVDASFIHKRRGMAFSQDGSALGWLRLSFPVPFDLAR